MTLLSGRLTTFWVAALLTLCLPPGASQTPPTLPDTPGLNLDAMDTSVRPGDDFYQYANGHWLATTAIPADEDQYGPGSESSQGNLFLLRELAEEAAADSGSQPDSPEGRIGSFYRAGMDEARIEAEAGAPLAPEVAGIDAVHDLPSLEAELGHLHRLLIFAGCTVDIGPDVRDSTREVVQLSQGGLGLPERGYYGRPDAQALRAAYMDHVAKMLVLLDEPPDQAQADAQRVLALETRLAVASKTPAELRDVNANSDKMTLTGLNDLTPGVDWHTYFTALGLPDPGVISVGQPQFFTALGQLLRNLPMSAWRAYLRWNLVSAESARLSRPFAEENFHFYGTVLQGILQMPPRWKRVLRMTDDALGEDLGRLYVARAFSPQAKVEATTLARNLTAALQDDLATLPWMGEATRQQASAKLRAMVVKVGYPDHWRDDAALDVTSPSYAVNGMRADQFEFQCSLEKLGRAVDRAEWNTSAATSDACYRPAMNDITLPAGILQPPYFSPDVDDAVNYGAIGAVIGHEMTHGFDDQGRRFDAQGDLRDWWSAQDAQAFDARAQGIVAQYSAYEPLPGAHIDGNLTEGENIADIGGLKIAYLALERSLQGKPRPKIDGFTPEQRFFLSFAQSWQRVTRPERLRVSLTTDPHSPARFRVLGSLADLPEFRAAFSLPPDPSSSPATVW